MAVNKNKPKESKTEIKQNENIEIPKEKLPETEGKKMIEITEVQTQKEKEIETSKTEIKEETAPTAVSSLINVIVLTPIFYGKRHEIGDVIEITEEEFKELKSKKLVAEFKE